ncbi:peptide/nickel transport system permease protein [Paenalcaligenes hominis]|uniref:Peptide ABC transporter n=1 Tax=Paenalcaligenes hominis TaxID=643674 RepID=A0A1U9JYQ9_9BURK|nr:ABC transporter permease [Paenalcaligenes hominis]AQS50859.1 peptide ABC transporter [Paenalcaligenes hominis]NJB64168.1 peptide/nickel transport system permease protein [Paenalcaligenes hominis]GGE75450.1 ABC transporter permease [Paenalcaligenes hominis]
MLAYIARRIVTTIPVVVMVAIVIFALLRLTPGDPAAIIAGDDASPAQLEAIRIQMGLNLPIYEQFFQWTSDLLKGNLGTSLLSNTPVTALIADRMGPTIALAIATLSFTLLIAIPIGVIAAWRHGKITDRFVMILSVLGFSIPTFVVGYLLIYIFSMKLGWFPVQGYRDLSSGFYEFARRLTLPTIALSAVYTALIARITRSSVIEVMNEDFVRTARAKGVKESTVLLRHALRNAAVPIVTVIGIGAASLIGGVVVTESVFNIPGLGRLVVEAVLARDYPIIQGVILLFSLTYIVINLIVDVLYTVFDPRITY